MHITSELVQYEKSLIGRHKDQASCEVLESIDGECLGVSDDILDASVVCVGPEEGYEDVFKQSLQFTIKDYSFRVLKVAA